MRFSICPPSNGIFALALWTHRTIESLLAGTIVGLFILEPTAPLQVLAEAFDTILDGFKTMISPLAVLAAAYLLKEINDGLNLSIYVIDLLTPYLTAQATGCTPYQHAITQIPYAIIAALVSVIGYLVIAWKDCILL